MFTTTICYEDGVISVQSFVTGDEATEYLDHVEIAENGHSDTCVGHPEVMWGVVSDNSSGYMTAMWKRTDDGFRQMYTGHVL